MDKRIKIKKYSKHPESEGDELQVVIIDNEKRKPRMRTTNGLRKPKQQRMTVNQLAITVSQLAGIVGQQGTKLDQLAITVNQLAVTVNNLAIEMRAGFTALNKEVSEFKETLKRHEEIFARNNLK
jgi:methyl-accepting chemotaxis protein